MFLVLIVLCSKFNVIGKVLLPRFSEWLLYEGNDVVLIDIILAIQGSYPPGSGEEGATLMDTRCGIGRRGNLPLLIKHYKGI